MWFYSWRRMEIKRNMYIKQYAYLTYIFYLNYIIFVNSRQTDILGFVESKCFSVSKLFKWTHGWIIQPSCSALSIWQLYGKGKKLFWWIKYYFHYIFFALKSAIYCWLWYNWWYNQIGWISNQRLSNIN